MLFAAILGIEFYLVSEPYSPEAIGYLRESSRLMGRLRSMMRPLLYRGYILMLRNRLSGIFAISRLAELQYHSAGMPSTRIFSFGYFIPADRRISMRLQSAEGAVSKSLRIIFVGSLIRTKGVDVLISAVRQLKAKGFQIQLDLYGPGDVASVPDDDEYIRYCGLIPFGQAQRVMCDYNLLVLPSRYDGWGVVVNEALCAGVPVVCSDRAGAGTMAAALNAGLVFPSGDCDALASILEQLASQPARLSALQSACGAAAKVIQPEVAAHYMLRVIQSNAQNKNKIPSPWYPTCK